MDQVHDRTNITNRADTCIHRGKSPGFLFGVQEGSWDCTHTSEHIIGTCALATYVYINNYITQAYAGKKIFKCVEVQVYVYIRENINKNVYFRGFSMHLEF